MFLRILVWLVLIVAGWMFLRPRGKGASLRGGAPGPRAVAPPEAMVDCAHCGLHLPASEAVQGDAGQVYCSAAHRAAGPRSVR
jgi:uncharacterized protein